MTTRSPVLLLLIAGLAVGAALLVFLMGGGEDHDVDSATRDVVVVDRTGDAAAEADLEGVSVAETARRSQDLTSALARAQGISGGLSARPAPVVPRGPYKGRILDHLGRPVTGVEVTLQAWADAGEMMGGRIQIGRPKPRMEEATTDGEGRFSVEPKKPLGRALGVSAVVRGYLKAPFKHVFEEADGNDLGDVVLEPAVIVEGWVRDQDGSPIANARVRRIERDGDAVVDMLDQIGFSGMLDLVRTDDDGRFELPHEKEGKIVLLAEHDDILAARYSGPARRGGEVLQDIVIQAQRAGKIRGHVVGYPLGRVRGVVAAAALDPSADETTKTGMSAIMSARFSPAGEHKGKVAADGSFTIGGLTPGARYELRVTERRRFVETVTLSDIVEAQADGAPASLRFDAGAEVTLRVIDRKTKKPVEAMSVSARWPDGVSKLQFTPQGKDTPKRFRKGEVKLHELRPDGGKDKLTITVEAPGYLRAKTKPVDVGASGLVDAGTVELVEAPRFHFRVIDVATREPIRKAKVTLSKGSAMSSEEAMRDAMLTGEVSRRAWKKTDRKGECVIAALGEETLVLTVRARGYAKYTRYDFDQSATTGEILIELSHGGAIQVTAVDTNGTPFTSGVRVQCRTDSEDTKSMSTKAVDGEGQALFEELLAGTYEVRALRGKVQNFGRRSREGDGEWKTVEVGHDRFVEVEYVLPSVGGLTGFVTMGNGPAVGARVSVVKEEDADQSERFIQLQDEFAGLSGRNSGDTTGPDGGFELTDIEPGAYVLFVRHPDVAMVTREDVEIDLGVSTIDVEILMTAIEGQVVDGEGGPIAGAHISVRQFNPEGDEEVRLTRSFLGMSKSTTRTDIDGHYVVAGVRADAPLQIVVQADGFTDAVSGTVTVSERETRGIPAIKLERAGTVLVTFASEEIGDDLYFATAKPEEGTAARDKIELMRGGRASIGGLTAGRWIIQAQRADRSADGGREGTATVTVEVKPGETVEVELEK